MAATRRIALLACIGWLLHTSPATGTEPVGVSRLVAVSWTDTSSGQGMVRGLDTGAPFTYATPPLAVGAEPILRYMLGRVYAVSPAEDRITVIDPDSWTVVREHALAPGSAPKDIAVVGPRTAFVTRAGSTRLLRLDLQTGEMTDAADLSPFADSDGNPDMAFMSLHESRLFVQIRRFDLLNSEFALPAMLAVLDAATGELVDASPFEPGVQPIELSGTAPKSKMQVLPSLRRLFLSASGDILDQGGLESINLDTLQTTGLVIEEISGQVGADLGPFVMVRPDRGFLAYSTDFGLSSHLKGFSVSGGVDPGPELFINGGYLSPVLAHDPVGDTVFVPQASPSGVQVLDAATGALLTSEAIPTGGSPVDLQLVYSGCGTGDVNGDGTANGDDIQTFVNCVLTAAAGCSCADLDASGHLDGTDAGLLTAALTQY